jgi:hypothetical protein
MRNVHKAQPAGEDAFRDTAHMDEGIGGGANGASANGKAAPPPQDDDFRDTLPPWIKGNELLALRKTMPGLLIGGPDEKKPLEGAILRKKRKLVVGGSSKMGKTWALLDLVLAVASGDCWLGKYKCAQGAVLYVNLELDGSTAGDRMAWLAEHRGLSSDDELSEQTHNNLLTWNLRGRCYDLAIMLACARMRMRDPDAPKLVLIVLDPIYKTLGGRDENSAGEMGTLMLELEQFADECGAAIAFAAHFSKGNQAGKEAMDRISGSGVIARDPDAIVTFTTHEEENCFVMEASLREFAPIPHTVFEWSAPAMMPRDDLDPAALRQAGKAATTKAPERAEAVRKALEAEGGSLPSRSALTAAIKKSGKFPDNAIISAWRKCLKSHPQALVDAGVEIVDALNGQDPHWRLKTADRKPSNDPF